MKQIMVAVLLAVLAGGAGYWLGIRQTGAPAAVEPTAVSTPAQKVFVCPMHSHIVQDHPGTCPICGMDLVAAEEAAGEAGTQIHVDTATQHKLGLRLARAEYASLAHDIATYGTIVPDEGAVLRITPNVDGVLTRLHVSRIGQRITAGQVLYEISSEDALNLQNEYIDILRRGAPARKLAETRRAQNREALAAAGDQDAATRERVQRGVEQNEEQIWSILQPLERDRQRVTLRLKQIGFTDQMLTKVAKTEQALEAVPARAQRSCVVTGVMARPGMEVSHMGDVLQCVDPARALLEVVLYPDHLPWVREGDAMTVELDDSPPIGMRLSGLNPIVDSTTRTVRARMPIAVKRQPNLGEYAKVVVHAAPREALSVPRSAVLRTGRRNYVMRAMGKGHFLPVEVVTGIETADRIAIIEGLEEGQEVAVNGQFLLDAAASIADAAQRFKAGNAPVQAAALH